MNLQQQRTALRTQLLDLSRLSQRALDYSIKAYEFNSIDFSRHPRSVKRQLKERYYQVKVLSRELIGRGVPPPSVFFFSLAALLLKSAFNKTKRPAARSAKATTLRLES